MITYLCSYTVVPLSLNLYSRHYICRFLYSYILKPSAVNSLFI